MKPPKAQRLKQQTGEDLQGALLGFIQGKFYGQAPAERVAFLKDRRRLREWVVLWPATWLNERGVSFPPERYQEIVTGILMDAVRYGNTEAIAYRPAWLGKVVQSHFRLQGESIYEEGKALRTAMELTLSTLAVVAGHSRPRDVVADMAAAAALLKAPKRKTQPAVKVQLNLW